MVISMNVHRVDKATEKVVNTEDWGEIPEETEDYVFVVQPGAGIGWSLVEGVLVPPPSPPPSPPTVPAKVHKYWLIKVLEALGEMDDIEDAMDAAWAAGNRSLKRDWLAATEIERANQLVNEFAAARGFTTAQVDAMFIQAGAYQAAAPL